ncbi:T. brucei spp.-specific protein [Trypanosoma brucei gambiense DAL972]|uniref:T. brucei spp.-specific protein n=1 Tax=Trypanosoma brucei gambiense (strain MHOM/CI/86/DAL972) TaxID=679716 RepID=C9ZYP9_TRYB9|nr:T. brucei spp.-specific protein [Trypanosoma brucei gambiense DAL972]CBH14548.1 T. brucei spp.-specific protein [Trypanosoma brucei gambiense DAL972]|eukprot:XP_011776814.1 T. brucei spp.-specific protein [Trypanosoma brucei gambiense DAL972]
MEQQQQQPEEKKEGGEWYKYLITIAVYIGLTALWIVGCLIHKRSVARRQAAGVAQSAKGRTESNDNGNTTNEHKKEEAANNNPSNNQQTSQYPTYDFSSNQNREYGTDAYYSNSYDTNNNASNENRRDYRM